MCFALLFRSHSAGAGLRRRVSIAVLPDRLLPPALQEAFRDADRWGCPENQPIHSLREGHQAHLCASTTCTMMSNSCGRAVPPCTKAWERNQRNSLSPLQAAGELGRQGAARAAVGQEGTLQDLCWRGCLTASPAQPSMCSRRLGAAHTLFSRFSDQRFCQTLTMAAYTSWEGRKKKA